eukprot:s4226_g3.t1
MRISSLRAGLVSTFQSCASIRIRPRARKVRPDNASCESNVDDSAATAVWPRRDWKSIFLDLDTGFWSPGAPRLQMHSLYLQKVNGPSVSVLRPCFPCQAEAAGWS